MTRPLQLELLLVEDNPSDVRLIKEAMGDEWEGNLHVCVNGTDAMAFLHQEQKYCNAPRPNLILLDLNLPQVDGREVLRQIKSDPKLRHIPVIILTTSESQRDINLVYQLGASCFLSKPQDLDEFFSMMNSILEFWIRRAQYSDLPESSWGAPTSFT